MNTIRSITYHLFPPITKLWPLNGLIKLTGQRMIFPFYHLVSDEEIPHVKHLYKVKTVKEFICDLDFLLSHYKPLGISDLLDSMSKEQILHGNYFLLSFDDGLREFHDIVAPILQRKGIPAVCFLNPGFVDNISLFYRYKASLLIEKLQTGKGLAGGKKIIEEWFFENHLPLTDDYRGLLEVSYKTRAILDELASIVDINFDEFLLNQRPYMDSTQIFSLIQQGFTFGAHSIDHPEYRFLEENEQIRQTAESIHLVLEKFGIKEKLFAFPFTDYGVKKTFFDIVFDPIQPLAQLTFGGAGLKNDSILRNIQRIPLEGTSLDARRIIGTEYLYYMIKAIFGKNMINR